MRRRREVVIGVSIVTVIVGLSLASTGFARLAAAQAGATVQAPMFEVDPLWPKPLPNHWVTGNNIGIAADAQDRIWMIHRVSGVGAQFKGAGASCCTTAPPIMGFDQAGNLVGNWGGPGQGYEWPQSEHGLWIDYQGNFWIGGNGEKDSQILKFTPEGKFLLQIGKQGVPQSSNDTKNLGKPADGTVDRAANEVYVADGYGNRRLIVFDSQTGAYKRHWGGYGNKPDDTNLGNYNPDVAPAQQFRPSAVHCAEISADNFVYVCDRANDRMQIFQKNGTFVKEKIIAKDTRGGSVWDIAWSRDPQQTYMYVADGSNHTIHILLRSTLEELTSIGIGGQQPGQFFGAHNVITDSKGNLYVAETYGTRIQKFVYKGLGPVTKKDQGAPWPRTAAN